MDKSPAISIVIPTYNHGDIIPETIGYIKAQTFCDFEVILVDDKSPDDSMEAANKAIAGDERFKLFSNEKNIGTSGTRNRGLDEATGKYVLFLDDDDIYQESMLEDFYHIAEANQVDITICKVGHFHVDTNEMKYADYYWQYIPFGNDFVEYGDMPEYWALVFRPSVWNKFYRRDFLVDHGIRFVNSVREDEIFSLESELNVDKIGLIDKPLMAHRLGHRQQTTMIMNSYTSNMNWWPHLKRIREQAKEAGNPYFVRGIDARIASVMIHTFNHAVRYTKNSDWMEYIKWVNEIFFYCGWDKCESQYFLPPHDNDYLQAKAIVEGSYINNDFEHIKTLKAHIEEFTNSKSWKITRPLRKVGKLFGRP